MPNNSNNNNNNDPKNNNRNDVIVNRVVGDEDDVRRTTPSGPPDRPFDFDERVTNSIVGSAQNQVVGGIINRLNENGGMANSFAASLITGLIEGQDIDRIATNFVLNQGARLAANEVIGEQVLRQLRDSVGTMPGTFNFSLENGFSPGAGGSNSITIDPVGIVANVVAGHIAGEIASSHGGTGGSTGAQIGSIIGNAILPGIGGAIGQVFGAIIGNLLNGDGLAERHGTMSNNISGPTDSQYSATTAFGTFAITNGSWFGKDMEKGGEAFEQAIVKLDEAFDKQLKLTPEQMEQAKENLSNTNFTYDFGTEQTGWHPSNRIITDRYAAILDVVDPNLGDIVRFSDPDRAGGVQEVLQTAIVLAKELQSGKTSTEEIAELKELIVDKLLSDVYLGEVKDPAIAYHGDPPEFLVEGKEEWMENEQEEAKDYLASEQELRAEIIANTDPKVIAEYNAFLKAKEEFDNTYDAKSNPIQPPKPPSEAVIELYDELKNAKPENPPLLVKHPDVPIYDHKGNYSGTAPFGSVAHQTSMNYGIETNSKDEVIYEEPDLLAAYRDDSEYNNHEMGYNPFATQHATAGYDDKGQIKVTTDYSHLMANTVDDIAINTANNTPDDEDENPTTESPQEPENTTTAQQEHPPEQEQEEEENKNNYVAGIKQNNYDQKF